MSKKPNTIRTKVIGWFLLAALAVLLTGIISYNSYKELLRSLDSPVSQGAKLKDLGDILVDITEAEAKMRAYALSKDPTQLDDYQQLVASIKQDLGYIKSVEPISNEFNLRVDSVSLLIDEQIDGVSSFIDLKNTINEISFSAKAMEEITNSTDSVPTLRTTTTTTTKTTTVEPISPTTEASNSKAKNTRRQQRKRAQEIAKELAKLEQEPQVQTETIVTTDTSYLRSDTLLLNIQQVLENLGKEESYYQRALAAKELALIESSITIIDQIRGLIGRLERQELALNIAMANDAKLIASKSTLTISIIIFVCLVVGILFTYLIFKDVRISDYYNKQLIGAKNQAELMAESKQKFLATMSHEIRTPLNAIIGFTERLNITDLKPKQQQYLQAIQTSSQQLLHTVNDILDYSKIEAGELRINQLDFELGNCLEEVIQALEVKANEKGLQLILETDPAKPLNLVGDPFRLKQVLFNLVSNGIKFTDTGYVKLRSQSIIEDDQATVNISVIDTGIGIPKQKRQEIFRDFKQVDDSTNRNYEGTGLGLAICKKLVEMQGGTIAVRSNGIQGSEFMVKLPYKVSTKQLSSPQESKPDTSTRSLEGLKVLAVDDDPYNIKLLQAILDSWKVQAQYCTDGEEAMNLVNTQSFDIILTDINMPRIDGMELSRYVRSLPAQQHNAKIPIIALTANVMESDLEGYKEAGIDDYVLKPFKEIDLYHKVANSVQDQPGPIDIQYNLDDFQKFSAGDKEALRPILETFYDSLKSNLKSLEEQAARNDFEEASKIAHKMISSFGHVHARSPVKRLRELENRIKSKQEFSLQQSVKEIKALATPILNGLEKEIRSLV